MLFTNNRTINVEEYTHTSVTTSRASLAPVSTKGHANFEFNGWRLAQGVAMTLCSQHLTKPEYWFDHISSLLSLSNLIHSPLHSHHLNVRIKSSRISSLRDFSRTNRIGEISQGLVYLYMQNTDFPYVNDFHFFCDINYISIPFQTSTPDFVCQDRRQTNQICLVESKGKETTSAGDIKSKLAKAISQCDSGENIIFKGNKGFHVKKSLGFCIEWSDEINADNSVLHFVDPENDDFNKDISSAPMRFHYASWFYMIGDFDNAQRLVDGEKIILNEFDFTQIPVNNKNYWILKNLPYSVREYQKTDLSIAIIDEIYFSNIFQGNIGISDKIMQSLINRAYDEITGIDFKNESTKDCEFFIDGTIIIKKKHE
ncbi:MAG: hypothetical protein EOO44_07860 [Flavobacterium sp.]|nr:MAG: hypothetical protein EOO44_07860 [Flavobacterium sp.]